MKLISKTIIFYLLLSLPLLLIAGACSYYMIELELQEETDEQLIKEKDNAIQLIRSFKEPHSHYLSADSLSSILITNNNYQHPVFSDTSIFDNTEEEYIGYRILKSNYTSNNINYLITNAKTTIEKDDLIEGLFSTIMIVITFLLITFFIVNWFLSKTLWKPFYTTLASLNNYDIKKQEQLSFEKTSTTEFDQLNGSLNKMVKKINSDFLKQKEFSENASHEMQTPLAVIKANVSLLMQSPNLKEEEMYQLQSIENTLKKLSALNRSLLLLTKIENNQFQASEHILLNDVITKTLNLFKDLIETKEIDLKITGTEKIQLLMDPVLSETLVSNLIQNAIRHNQKGGTIKIEFKPDSLIIANTGAPINIGEDELFVRFKKNDNSKDSLGLGLSIVKSICNLYNFKINYSYTNKEHIFTINF